MRRQKRIALVNDVTGFGRCSVAVELPLISALKVQACPLPTAILSCHTGFPTHFLDDYTDRMRPYMEDWQKNGVQFDGICTGFLGSAQQIEIVADFIRMFKQPGTRVMVDPVMGDYGRLYSSYTQEMCERMKQLLALADIVTPNLTEACRLLDRPYPEDGRMEAQELEYMAAELADRGPSQVVITGLSEGEMIENFIYEAGRGTLLREKKIGGDRRHRRRESRARRAAHGCRREGGGLHQQVPRLRRGARPAMELRPAVRGVPDGAPLMTAL